MNRRITVLTEMRNIDVDSAEPWTLEDSFTYDPSSLTPDGALEMRPKIDFAIRQLRVTGDYLDSWLKRHIKEAGENT